MKSFMKLVGVALGGDPGEAPNRSAGDHQVGVGIPSHSGLLGAERRQVGRMEVVEQEAAADEIV